jgi:hypothetical protein
MPSGSSLIGFTYVNIMFFLQLFVMVLLGNIKKIKDNWPVYRCNPLFMGLSDNIAQDFAYSVQNMQTDFFSILIEPMNIIVSGLSSLGTILSDNILSITNLISDLRFNITELFENVFSMFGNIIVVFEKLGFSLIDIFKRIIGGLAIAVYGTMTGMYGIGSLATMITLIGKGKFTEITCFSPHTILTLNTNENKKIKHIKIGDILKNGSKITGILKLANNQYMYKLKEKGINKNIRVTGKHFILYNNNFIPVENHPHFKLTNKICPFVYNLITDNHLIPIREYLFWDYNDDIFKL